MNKFLNVFKPNAEVSKGVMGTLVLFQLTIGLLFWQYYLTNLIPKPIEIWGAFVDLWYNDSLAREILTSLSLNLAASALTIAISQPLAYLTVFPFFRPIAKFISTLRYLGLVGLTFVFTVMTSSSYALKLTMLVFGMTTFHLTSMLEVIANVSEQKNDYAKTLRLGPCGIIWHVYIMGTLGLSIEVFCQNSAIGWQMLTTVEGLVRVDGGVATILLNMNKHMKLDHVFAVLICICLVGLAWDYCLRTFKHIACPHLRKRS